MQERENANIEIYNLLTSENPCFIGRIGTSEGQVIANYLAVHSDEGIIKRIIQYIRGESKLPWWDTGRPFSDICINSGFFPGPPPSVQDIEKFCRVYLKYIPLMDMCGRYEYYEKLIPFNKECRFVQLETLYPFFVKQPWIKALEGKNVLVVHPFKDSILSQYNNRKVLFTDSSFLPDFKSLTVIKAVQTLAGEISPFINWFYALDYMKSQINQVEFDIALIGCGAYGLPLAGYCKEIGKKAIHLGGGLQLLFGIKGKRWEEQYNNPCYRDMFNSNWVYPLASERIKNAHDVEGACYW